MPVTSETRAFLRGIAVPLRSITVLGLRRLQLDIPKSDALEALRKSGTTEVTLELVTPDQPTAEQTVTLQAGPAAQPAKSKTASWVAEPDSGAGPLAILLKPSDKAIADNPALVTKVEALLADGKRTELEFAPKPKAKAIEVHLPDADRNRRAVVDFWITRASGAATGAAAGVDSVKAAFRYRP